LSLEAPLERLHGLVELLLHRLDVLHRLVVLDDDRTPLAGRELREERVVDRGARLRALETAGEAFAHQHGLHTLRGRTLQDRAFIVAILRETLDFLTLDLQRALVLVDAATREDAHFDDRAGHTRRQAQRRVAHVRRLFAEDGAQQLFFRRHRAFALRRDLADQNVARLHFGADIGDAGFVEVLQRFFAHVGDVARDFFLTQLRVAGHHFELFDVDRGEHVVLDTIRSEIRIESSKL
jgi:hypothetical protein